MTVPATLQMMGQLAPASGAFGASQVDGKAINEGIGQSFAILTYRGKVWRIKFRGEETDLMMPPTQPGMPPTTARPTIEVVIINASPVISKIWYEDGYIEGSTEAPDCFSVNGMAPDPASPKKQNDVCATCPKNMWGSKTTAAGKPGKACQDSKRLVVVPANDLANEMFGGPMLLRIPPASLQDMGQYASVLQQYNHKFYTVKTQLGFDHNMAYPKITFTPLQAIPDADAPTVLALQEDPRTKRILSEAVDQVRHEVPPATAQQAAAAQLAPPTPALVQQPVQQTVPVPVVNPTMQPGSPVEPDLTIPAALDRRVAPVQATIPAPLQAAAPVVQQEAPAQPVVQQPAPTPAAEAFRVLTPQEMGALPPEQMMAYVAQLQSYYAAQAAATPVAGRGRRPRAATAAAVTAPPSPAPADSAATPAATPAPVPVLEQAASPADAAVIAGLNDKLASLLG